MLNIETYWGAYFSNSTFDLLQCFLGQYDPPLTLSQQTAPLSKKLANQMMCMEVGARWSPGNQGRSQWKVDTSNGRGGGKCRRELEGGRLARLSWGRT